MFKTPHHYEIHSIVQFLAEELAGAQLQSVQSSKEGLVLGFYRYHHFPKIVYLVLDLDPVFPYFGMFEENPWLNLKATTPVGLFLNSHFKNRNLFSIEMVENLGRVVRFYFTSQKDFYFELRLIPKQVNLIAYANDKKISWVQVKNLESQKFDLDQIEQLETRSVHFMNQQWSNVKANKNFQKNTSIVKSPFDKWVIQKTKDQQKKIKALEGLDKQIHNPLIETYQAIGEHLKTNGYKNLPLEWTSHVDFEQRPSWNIEHLFTKSKSLKLKSEGASQRKEILLKEIKSLSQLSEKDYQVELERQLEKKKNSLNRKPTAGQLRKFVLDEGKNLICWIGKNAQENMKLLRSSKSWDLWIHLKDYPSAYAILQKTKDQKVSDQDLIKSAQWLVTESFKNKNTIQGLKIAVVVTECRFVKPIKGDKIGRVTYHNPRELLITV